MKTSSKKFQILPLFNLNILGIDLSPTNNFVIFSILVILFSVTFYTDFSLYANWNVIRRVVKITLIASIILLLYVCFWLAIKELILYFNSIPNNLLPTIQYYLLPASIGFALLTERKNLLNFFLLLWTFVLIKTFLLSNVFTLSTLLLLFNVFWQFEMYFLHRRRFLLHSTVAAISIGLALFFVSFSLHSLSNLENLNESLFFSVPILLKSSSKDGINVEMTPSSSNENELQKLPLWQKRLIAMWCHITSSHYNFSQSIEKDYENLKNMQQEVYSFTAKPQVDLQELEKLVTSLNKFIIQVDFDTGFFNNITSFQKNVSNCVVELFAKHSNADALCAQLVEFYKQQSSEVNEFKISTLQELLLKSKDSNLSFPEIDHIKGDALNKATTLEKLILHAFEESFEHLKVAQICQSEYIKNIQESLGGLVKCNLENSNNWLLFLSSNESLRFSMYGFMSGFIQFDKWGWLSKEMYDCTLEMLSDNPRRVEVIGEMCLIVSSLDTDTQQELDLKKLQGLHAKKATTIRGVRFDHVT